MRYVPFGATGLKVSSICLGGMSFGQGRLHSQWTLSEADSMPILRRAFEAGINFVDTSDGYAEGESEVVLGKAIRLYARREEIVIATKFWAPTGPGENERGASRKHIMTAVDASLRRLGVEYIDLYQQHIWDAATPLEETLRALDDLVRMGKVLHTGASNFRAWQLAKALQVQAAHRWTRLASMQVQYNLIYREEEREMLPLCQDQGIAVLCWSALARGFLAGNHGRDGGGATARANSDQLAKTLYCREQDFALRGLLEDMAARRAVAPTRLALAWFSGRFRSLVPIIGITRMSQLDDVLAAGDSVLTAEEQQALDRLYVTRPPFIMGQ